MLAKLYDKLQKDAIKQGVTTPLVFGEGKFNPSLMLIGEAPGANEEKEGRPFVGKAGQNLNAFLQSLNLERQELFVSNVVKIRPFKLSGSGNKVNRPPTKEEKAFFTPYLLEEVSIVNPKIIVTLGNTSLNAFCSATVGQVHGTMLTWQNFPLFPLYHPAAVIYNRALQEVYEKDIARLKHILDKGI